VNLQHLRTLLGVLVAATMIAAGVSLAEETHDFARYQVIVDRSPFGPVPGSQATATALPSFATRFALVGIVQSNGQDGVVQAIIEDKGSHNTYFKTVGEAVDDVKVLHIEVEKPQSIVLQRGLETATLTFAELGSKTPTAAASAPQAGSALQPGPAAPVPVGVRRIPFRRGD
jgi:hypothetical protein